MMETLVADREGDREKGYDSDGYGLPYAHNKTFYSHHIFLQ